MAIYRDRKRFGGGIPATGDNILVTYEEETDTLNNTLPKLGKVKTVNGEGPDENGNIEVGFKVWTGTLAQYLAMSSHDPSTMYLIKG